MFESKMSNKEQAKRSILKGNAYPYDCSADNKTLPVDWAHAAARGILADLSDRTHIKDTLLKVSPDVRSDLIKDISEIIRVACAIKFD